MPRALRDESPGIHHVVTRGNNKETIYRAERDRTLFALITSTMVRARHWRILGYAMMRNHYHLLVWTLEQDLSAGMQQLNHRYAMTFNAEYGRVNHAFGKRFWNRRLTTEAMVQNAARYIVQNPLRAGLTKTMAPHPWTSYAATLGLEFAAMPLATDDLLRFFGGRRGGAVAAFERFCQEQPSRTELDEPCLVPGTVS